MDAKKCDRCGALYNPWAFGNSNAWRYSVVKDCHPYPEEYKLDLCHNCSYELEKWIGSKANGKDL